MNNKNTELTSLHLNFNVFCSDLFFTKASVIFTYHYQAVNSLKNDSVCLGVIVFGWIHKCFSLPHLREQILNKTSPFDDRI